MEPIEFNNWKNLMVHAAETAGPEPAAAFRLCLEQEIPKRQCEKLTSRERAEIHLRIWWRYKEIMRQ
jgi:hypothetical protein